MTEFNPEIQQYPTDAQLAELFTDATTWLQENRPVEGIPSDGPERIHNNLPLVREDPPMHSLTLHGTVVREHLPGVAERMKLRSQDELRITYMRACYVQGRNVNGKLMDIEFRTGEIIATVEHSEPYQNGEIAEITRLYFDQEEGWEFTADSERESEPALDIDPGERWLEAIFDLTSTEEPATLQHYQDLAEIIRSMPSLHQAMQDAGFDMVNDDTLQQTMRDERKLAFLRAYALGELDGERAQLFSEPQPASSYEDMLPAYVRVAGITLRGAVELGEPGKQLQISAEELKLAKIACQEVAVALYWYGEDFVSELTLTQMPNPTTLAQGIDRIDQIVTFYNERYTRQLRIHKNETSVIHDVTAERPLEFSFALIPGQLLQILRARSK